MYIYAKIERELNAVLDRIRAQEGTALFEVKTGILDALHAVQESDKKTIKAQVVYGMVIVLLAHYSCDSDVKAYKLMLEQSIGFYEGSVHQKDLDIIKVAPTILKYLTHIKGRSDLRIALSSLMITMRVEAIYALFGWVLNEMQDKYSIVELSKLETSPFLDSKHITSLSAGDDVTLERQVIYSILAVLAQSHKLNVTLKTHIWFALQVWLIPKCPNRPILTVWPKTDLKISPLGACDYLLRILLEGVEQAVDTNNVQPLEKSVWAYMSPTSRENFLNMVANSWQERIKAEIGSQDCVLAYDEMSPDGHLAGLDYTTVAPPWDDIPEVPEKPRDGAFGADVQESAAPHRTHVLPAGIKQLVSIIGFFRRASQFGSTDASVQPQSPSA